MAICILIIIVGSIIIITSAVTSHREQMALIQPLLQPQAPYDDTVAILEHTAENLARMKANEMFIEEPIQIWTVDVARDIAIWLIRYDWMPELTAFLRIVKEDSFSDITEKKCRRCKDDSGWCFMLNGIEYKLKGVQ
jgi:hypothetical protein